MRLVSARRTRSPAAGRSAARAQVRPATSAPLPPTSSVPSARNRVRVSPDPADLQHRGDEPAPGGDRRHRRARRTRRTLGRSGRLAPVDGLVVPPNITIMALPPKCPELNPVENVWQFLRDNWLSNRVFKSYDDLVDHCCVAWNKLVNQPWRIMSIGLRQWAHRF